MAAEWCRYRTNLGFADNHVRGGRQRAGPTVLLTNHHHQPHHKNTNKTVPDCPRSVVEGTLSITTMRLSRINYRSLSTTNSMKTILKSFRFLPSSVPIHFYQVIRRETKNFVNRESSAGYFELATWIWPLSLYSML